MPVLGILIRNEDKIKGIKMGNIEHILNQFADDTSLSLDGSEKGLYVVMNILNFFARFSGLKVNTEIKVLWVPKLTSLSNYALVTFTTR